MHRPCAVARRDAQAIVNHLADAQGQFLRQPHRFVRFADQIDRVFERVIFVVFFLGDHGPKIDATGQLVFDGAVDDVVTQSLGKLRAKGLINQLQNGG